MAISMYKGKLSPELNSKDSNSVVDILRELSDGKAELKIQGGEIWIYGGEDLDGNWLRISGSEIELGYPHV